MNTKWIVASIIGVGLLIGGVMVLPKGSPNNSLPTNANNVSVVDGKQIIDIDVRGGYEPKKSVAKAGLPTVIRFNTSGTFDCSLALRIPSLNVSQMLPQTGNTQIDIGTQPVGKLNGLCSMGMYRFEIEFE
jgi:plastocyanin domain-containing protein